MSLPTELSELISASQITSSFVVNQRGLVVNDDGSSLGIGNDSDKTLLRALRANAEIVLTSGRTARADRYRMPKTADLAILTKHGVEELDLTPKDGQKLLVLSSAVGGFSGAIEHLQNLGYNNIHVEYGPTGFIETRDQIQLLTLSGTSEDGIKLFAAHHNLFPRARFELTELVVWAC